MDIDDVLPHVGEYGRYQKLLLFLVCLPACFPCGFHAFNQVFMMETPDHWCAVPNLALSNRSQEQRRQISIPFEDGKFSQCSFYDIDYANLDPEITEPNSSWPIAPCKYGWEFDTSEIFSSIVIDYELVCSKAMMPTVSLAILSAGGLIGTITFGMISDHFGRKKAYFICLSMEIIGGIVTAWAPEIISFCIIRFIVGLTVPAILQIPFVICLELVGPEKRTHVSFLSNIFYVVGLLAFSGVAYGVRDWRNLAYATAAPFIAFYVYWIVLPESPRWLLAHGQWEQLSQFFNKVARINGKQVPENLIEKFKGTVQEPPAKGTPITPGQSLEQEPEKEAGLRDLFRTPNLRLKTILITFSWVVNETVYVGLSYYGPAMGSDGYLSFFLSCVVEIPGYFICLLTMDRFGRRLPLCFLMITSGIAAISTAVMPSDAEMATLVLYLIAKMTIAAGTMIIFQFGGELYPTEVRGVGIGFSSYLGNVGVVIIPFINYLGSQWLALPIAIMGAFTILGGILSLRLPETLNQPLPQTVADGEVFGKDFTCWPRGLSTLKSVFRRPRGTTGKFEIQATEPEKPNHRPQVFLVENRHQESY